MSSWSQVKLGDICTRITDGSHNPPKGVERSDFLMISSKNVEDDRITFDDPRFLSERDFLSENKRTEVAAGDVLLTIVGSIGRVAVVPAGLPQFTLQRSVAVLKPRQNIVLSRFLMYLLQSGLEVLTEGARGVAQKGIYLGALRELVFVLPPLPEQQRIVAILDEAFAGLATATANAEKNLKNARELFESYLNAVFEGARRDWTETTLGSEIDLLVGFAFKSAQYTKSESGIRLLRGDNVIQNAVRWEDVKRWPVSDVKRYEAYKLEVGDIVLAMDRTWVKAGLKYAVLDKADVPSLLVQRVARLRCREQLDNRFLVHLIGSPKFTRYVLGIQTGLSVPHISGKQISDFAFRKPGMSEQRKIGTAIDELASNVVALEDAYREKLTGLADLKQSILQKAFSGELTSPPSRAIKEAAE